MRVWEEVDPILYERRVGGFPSLRPDFLSSK